MRAGVPLGMLRSAGQGGIDPKMLALSGIIWLFPEVGVYFRSVSAITAPLFGLYTGPLMFGKSHGDLDPRQ